MTGRGQGLKLGNINVYLTSGFLFSTITLKIVVLRLGKESFHRDVS